MSIVLHRPLSAALSVSAASLSAAALAAGARAESRISLHEALGAPRSLTLEGQARVRYETIDGQPRAGFDESDELLSLRTILFAEQRAGRFRIGARFYDSRAWLADAGTPLSAGEVDAAELVEAYVGAELPGLLGEGSKLALQAGRFKLDLGSRRLVADDDFRNTTNGFTGLRADVVLPGGAKAVLVSVLPQIRLPDDAQGLRDNAAEWDRETFDLQLHGGIATLPLARGASLDLTYFRLIERDQPDMATRDRHLDTAGARLYREPRPGALDFDAEVLGQWGDVSGTAAPGAPILDVGASYVHTEIGRQWAVGWRPRIGVEYDYASGDDPGGDYGRFDTLYGMRRAELGPAGLYNAVGRANLDSLGVRLEVTPSPRWDAFAALRDLRLASETDSFSTTGVRDATGASGGHAGTQVDARVRWRLVPDTVLIEANGTWLARGRFLEQAPNAGADEDAVYLTLSTSVFF